MNCTTGRSGAKQERKYKGLQKLKRRRTRIFKIKDRTNHSESWKDKGRQHVWTKEDSVKVLIQNKGGKKSSRNSEICEIKRFWAGIWENETMEQYK